MPTDYEKWLNQQIENGTISDNDGYYNWCCSDLKRVKTMKLLIEINYPDSEETFDKTKTIIKSNIENCLGCEVCSIEQFKMEYISKDYLLQALSVFSDYENGDEHFLNGIETAKEIIENAPTNCESCYKRDDCEQSMPLKVRPFDCPDQV